MDDGFRAFLGELLEPLGGVSMRRMFGGLAIYRDGRIFALVIDDTLYLKGDAATQPVFEAEGCGPFTYAAKGERTVQMPYWRLPERLLDDQDELLVWCRRAIEAALRIEAEKAARPARSRKPKKGAAKGASGGSS